MIRAARTLDDHHSQAWLFLILKMWKTHKWRRSHFSMVFRGSLIRNVHYFSLFSPSTITFSTKLGGFINDHQNKYSYSVKGTILVYLRVFNLTNLWLEMFALVGFLKSRPSSQSKFFLNLSKTQVTKPWCFWFTYIHRNYFVGHPDYISWLDSIWILCIFYQSTFV